MYNAAGDKLPENISIEDLNFARIGHCVRSGSHTWHGRVIPDYRHVGIFRTKYGDFSPEDWVRTALHAVENAGQHGLYLKVLNYCKNNCFWLKSDHEFTEYALSCMSCRAYENWSEFADYKEGKQEES